MTLLLGRCDIEINVDESKLRVPIKGSGSSVTADAPICRTGASVQITRLWECYIWSDAHSRADAPRSCGVQKEQTLNIDRGVGIEIWWAHFIAWHR